MKQFNIKQCRICGGTEFVKGVQEFHGSILGENEWAAGQPLYHIICLNCGSVLHSYVEHPTSLLTRKHREQYEQARKENK